LTQTVTVGCLLLHAQLHMKGVKGFKRGQVAQVAQKKSVEKRRRTGEIQQSKLVTAQNTVIVDALPGPALDELSVSYGPALAPGGLPCCTVSCEQSSLLRVQGRIAELCSKPSTNGPPIVFELDVGDLLSQARLSTADIDAALDKFRKHWNQLPNSLSKKGKGFSDTEKRKWLKLERVCKRIREEFVKRTKSVTEYSRLAAPSAEDWEHLATLERLTALFQGLLQAVLPSWSQEDASLLCTEMGSGSQDNHQDSVQGDATSPQLMPLSAMFAFTENDAINIQSADGSTHRIKLLRFCLFFFRHDVWHGGASYAIAKRGCRMASTNKLRIRYHCHLVPEGGERKPKRARRV